MAWVTLAASDVQAAISVNEYTVYRRDSIQAGQADPITQLLTDVTNLVRGFAGRCVALGPVGTIPEKLKNAAVDIVIYRLETRMKREPIAARTAAYEGAMELLHLVGNREFDLEEPLIVTENSVAPQSRITSRTRYFTSDTQDGL